jgi:hypothetical protein
LSKAVEKEKLTRKMLRIFAIILSLNIWSSAAFVVRSSDHDVRIQDSKTFVATPIGGVDIGEKQALRTKTGPRRPKVNQLSNAEDYMDFLLEDEKLCMVK